jgi:class 3 adenylate cyclase
MTKSLAMPTRNLAIMFTDVKGFTERVSRGKRDDLKQLLSTHEHLLTPVIQHFEGIIVKTIGDSFLARFDSSTEAVLCGVTIQEVLRQHNASAPDEEKLEVRVAVNTGDVELINDDVMGETVNLAARLEGIAEAGEVYFTEAVYLAMNRREAPSTEIGERTFAGIPYAVRVYKVIRDPNSELARRVEKGVRLTERGPVLRGLHESRSRARHSRWIWAAIIGVAAIALAAWLYHATRPQPPVKETAARQAETGDQGKTSKAKESSDTISPGAKIKPEAALEAARKQVESLRQSQGAAVALDFLRKGLDRSPELEPLRSQVPDLDAQATAESILQGSMEFDAMDSAVAALLARYPKSANVPLKLARSLEGKVYPTSYPLRIYKAAIERGANPHDRHIFELCIRLFSSHYPGQVETAHGLLQRHFSSEAQAWARRAIDVEESGVVFENAWNILRDRKDASVDNPLYRALYRLTYGYPDEEAADQDLAVFQQVKDRNQQAHILAMYRWVLKPLEEKGVSSSGYSHNDLAERNLARLESIWKKP